ncbi:MAG: NAD-dependent DNA ligase LigA [Lachnospiraceae bacterium]|nr:NAD-dependent DNA ligase LigA [Lachnospiraceae bacterium]
MENDKAKLGRIKELIDQLNEARLVYYQKGREIMPNIEYDRLFDELVDLEKETGIVLANSPTQNVGYEVVSELPKERHESPMLSLDKTKSPEDLKEWLNGKKGVLSWKLDGITCVVTYEGGSLVKAVTRGNGEIGEVVTGNARFFENLPGQIPFKGKLIIRGEAVISYSDFDKINEEIADTAAKYKNPRNLCSGSVRQLDPSVTAGRHVHLIVFTLVSCEGTEAAPEVPDFHNSFAARFDWLEKQGFEVVEHVFTDASTIDADINRFKEKIPTYDIPSDGLVLAFEDVAYGESLGRTARFPRHSIAFKWQDELAETVLREIDWSASRTGLINPVAVFDPVELEGTTVTRASVHNVSIVEELELGIGDHITVYKANMIIPQISDNLTRSGNLEIPKMCPVCGGATEVRRDGNATLLYCTNPDCPAKKVKSFAQMVSRDALNIDGLSEKTLEKLLGEGFIHHFADLFRLEEHRAKIAELEGFGDKSADNLIAAAERASETDLFRLIYGLGIPGVGLAGAKLIARTFGNDLGKVMGADAESLMEIEGIGPVLADNFVKFFKNEWNREETKKLAEQLHFRAAETGADSAAEASAFAGKTFVITGDVHVFRNRREVTDLIESLGGKAAGSVSAKTAYLINNDILSGSSKNKKAKELGIPIITEENFIAMLPEDRRPSRSEE